MMEVEKPWEVKEKVNRTIMEEEEEDEEDAEALLHTRERKNKTAAAAEAEPTNSLDAQEEEARNEEEEEQQKQSVFFDSTNGLWKCRHCDWTYRLTSPCTDHILNHQGYCQIERNLELLVRNEPFYYSTPKVSEDATKSSTEQDVTSCGREKDNESAQGQEPDKQENFDAQENNKKLENGLHANGVQEASSSSETNANGEAGAKLIATVVASANSLPNRGSTLDISNTITNRTQVHEIEVEKDENDTKSKVNIEEYDLEKILDEQETHDLYCPNCKSCITRRVILRKRKRTVRQALRDEPPKKPQIVEPSAAASNQMVTERHDQDAPEVFRCLSCFTFFIPAGCGFNIFRIFQRRDMNQQVQVQHPSASHESDNCGSWLLSCFHTVDSPKQSADTDPAKDPLLSGSQSTSDTLLLVEENTASAHIHATGTKIEQLQIPSPAESSSMVQANSAKEEGKMEQLDGTTSSSGTVHTSSSITSTVSSSQSKTGFMQTEARWKVTGQQDVECQEQNPVLKPTSNASSDAIHLDRKEDVPHNTTEASRDKISFLNQEIFSSEFKFPNVIPNKVSPEVNTLSSWKPTAVIPAPVQSESESYVAVPIIPSGILPTPIPASAQTEEWDILKAIVYGGLVESITSLSVVSAAAATGAKTLDIFVLGIANLIGGLPILFHSIADLKNLGDANEIDERLGHYWLHLGRRSKYQLHMVIAVISYILFGLLPPVIYGLSFRKSDNRENKMMVVAAASLACIALLAIGKAHVKRPRTYFTTLLYYLSIGLSGSGLSYVAGVLLTRLLAHFGLIDQGGSAPSAPPNLLLPDAMGAGATSWASY